MSRDSWDWWGTRSHKLLPGLPCGHKGLNPFPGALSWNWTESGAARTQTGARLNSWVDISTCSAPGLILVPVFLEYCSIHRIFMEPFFYTLFLRLRDLYSTNVLSRCSQWPCPQVLRNLDSNLGAAQGSSFSLGTWCGIRTSHMAPNTHPIFVFLRYLSFIC